MSVPVGEVERRGMGAQFRLLQVQRGREGVELFGFVEDRLHDLGDGSIRVGQDRIRFASVEKGSGINS